MRDRAWKPNPKGAQRHSADLPWSVRLPQGGGGVRSRPVHSWQSMALPETVLPVLDARREFLSTHWSAIIAARDPGSPRSAAALESLCRDYWFPLYSFVRRSGLGPEEAADLTQEFFSRLLTNQGLASVSPEKGRFRSFLIASIKNLLTNERERSRCLKRGGGQPVFSLEELDAEGRYLADLTDDSSPDRLFDRRWAESILARALARLRRECDGDDGSRRFEQVKGFLMAEREGDSIAAAAVRLKLSLPATKGLIHRLRRRFAELIRHEVAQTMVQPTQTEIDREIRELFVALERP